MGVSSQRHALAALTPGIYRMWGRPQGPFGPVRKFRFAGIRYPNRPARSESLYVLHYPGSRTKHNSGKSNA
jgi:hypothetical protein